MPTHSVLPVVRPRAVELDLVADYTCPWSYLGTRRIARALESLRGVPAPTVRWHGFRLPRSESPSSWRTHLAQRLPPGITREFAEASLAEAGLALGIRFDFSRLAGVPDTTDAHRLTRLAAAEGRAEPVSQAIFRAYFEQGRDIGSSIELARIGREAGLNEATLREFSESQAGRDEITAEERRLAGFGVSSVPNVLINGRVLVPGAADVPTYVLALDQAMFPTASEDSGEPTRH